MRLIRSPLLMQRWAMQRSRQAGRTGFVPTMGALHEGHLSLMRRARRECKRVVVSIFVNPLQFGPKEDFRRYPRNLREDLALIRKVGADVVFAPEPSAMYPAGFSTTVDVQPLGLILEGKIRPGHFRGVVTVVAKLLGIIKPDMLYLGQKDYQQAAILARMVEDLSLPTRVKICPTVREPSGLAMSSRNAYLSPATRLRAAVLRRALAAGGDALLRSHGRATPAERAMRQVLEKENGFSVDYAVAADASLNRLPTLRGRAVLLVAARVEKVRLIDNLLVDVP